MKHVAEKDQEKDPCLQSHWTSAGYTYAGDGNVSSVYKWSQKCEDWFGGYK